MPCLSTQLRFRIVVALWFAVSVLPDPLPARSEQSDQVTTIRAVVGYPSYARRVDRLSLLRHHQLREALIFTLKWNGIAVAPETLLPRRSVDFEFIPIERLKATAASDCVVVHLQVDEGVEVRIDDPVAEMSTVVRIEKSEGDLLPSAERVCHAILDARGRELREPLTATGELDAEWLADDHRLDESYVQRLTNIQALLSQLDAGQRQLMVPVKAATYHALHGSYFCRTSEIHCIDHFARALMWAEMVSREAPRDSLLVRFHAEIQLLAKRFVAGLQAQPPHEPLLAETRTLSSFENLGLDDVETYPSILNLFDFLVRREAQLNLKGYTEELDRFAEAHPWPLDVGLIWAKPGRGDFFGNMFVANKVAIADGVDEVHGRQQGWIHEMIAAAAAVDLRYQPELYRLTSEFDLQRIVNPWDLLDNTGARSYGPDDVYGDDGALTLLGFMSLFDREIRSAEPQYSSSFALRIRDISQELMDRYVELAMIRRERWEDQAHDVAKEKVDVMLARFGIERTCARKQFRAAASLHPGSVLDWDRFLDSLAQGAERPRASLAKHILDCLDPELRRSIQNRSADEETPAAERQAIAHALDAMIQERDFYDPDVFANVAHPDWLLKKLAHGIHRISRQDLARGSYELLQAAFPNLLADIDYTNRGNSRWQRELAFRLEPVEEAFFAGDFQRAFELIHPLAERFDREEPAVDLVQECMFRTGRVDDALNVLGGIWTSHFERDNYVLEVLKWRRDDFGDFGGARFPPQKSTNSASDYIGRAEYAFRVGNYETVIQIAEQYHYSGNHLTQSYRTVAEILKGGQDDQQLWLQLEAAMNVCFDKGNQNRWYANHWVALLDERLGDNEHWARFKQKLNLEQWASWNEATLTLRSNPSEDELRETWLRLKTISDSHFEGKRLMRALVQDVLEAEHEALARYILAATDRLARADQLPEAKQWIVDLVRKTQQFFHPDPTHPQELKFMELDWLATMVRFGANTDRVATFCAGIADVSALYHGDERYSIALACPPGLQVHLDDFKRRNMRWTTDRGENPRWQLHQETYQQPLLVAMFVAAYRAGHDQGAIDLALYRALHEKEVDLISYYLPDEQAATQWVVNNAPTQHLQKRWLKEIAGPNRRRKKVWEERGPPSAATESLQIITYLSSH